MDFYATLMTGIYWGLIIDACWIIPYFALLFYHFFQMENSPAYAMRYQMAERKVKKLGTKEAVIQESQIRIVKQQIKMMLGMLEGLFIAAYDQLKKLFKRGY